MRSRKTATSKGELEMSLEAADELICWQFWISEFCAPDLYLLHETLNLNSAHILWSLWMYAPDMMNRYSDSELCLGFRPVRRDDFNLDRETEAGGEKRSSAVEASPPNTFLDRPSSSTLPPPVQSVTVVKSTNLFEPHVVVSGLHWILYTGWHSHLIERLFKSSSGLTVWSLIYVLSLPAWVYSKPLSFLPQSKNMHTSEWFVCHVIDWWPTQCVFPPHPLRPRITKMDGWNSTHLWHHVAYIR